MSQVKTAQTSNIKFSNKIMDKVTAAFTTTFQGDADVAIKWDDLKTDIRWTDTVAPTKANLANGKSTCEEEQFTQLKEVVKSVLLQFGKGASTTEVGSKVQDIKNAMMLRQDPGVYAETKGNLSLCIDHGVYAETKGNLTKIESVREGVVTLKTKVELTAEEKNTNNMRTVLAFINNNKVELGNRYKTLRNASLSCMETMGIKV